MGLLKAIGNTALILLTCVSVVVLCGFAYYQIYNDDITIGVNNIDSQVALDIIEKIEKDDGSLTPEQIAEYESRKLLNVNYYDNSKNNGVELAELRFDYFTTYHLRETDYRSTGMQYVGNYTGDGVIKSDNQSVGFHTIFMGDVQLTNEEYAEQYVDPAFYYYDTTNGISWNGSVDEDGSVATKLNRATTFVISIDRKPFAIQLTGWWNAHIGYMRNGFGWEYADVYSKQYWTYSSVFKTVLKAVKTNSVGYGDYYITVDLSDYFTIFEYDPENGKFKDTDDNDTIDIIKNYAVLKFHYDENGASQSSQSLYDIIENNRNFDLFGVTGDTTYWQERMVYNLTEDDLNLRYSEVYGGYFASLPLDMKNMFDNMARAKVNIAIDLTDKNIIGLDYNAFENLAIDTLRLYGTPQDFYLLDKCLSGTGLKAFEYDGINIVGEVQL